MHSYKPNPKEGKVEDVRAPSTDEEALAMLSGHPDSGRFVERYVVLRDEGRGWSRRWCSWATTSGCTTRDT